MKRSTTTTASYSLKRISEVFAYFFLGALTITLLSINNANAGDGCCQPDHLGDAYTGSDGVEVKVCYEKMGVISHGCKKNKKGKWQEKVITVEINVYCKAHPDDPACPGDDNNDQHDDQSATVTAKVGVSCDGDDCKKSEVADDEDEKYYKDCSDYEDETSRYLCELKNCRRKYDDLMSDFEDNNPHHEWYRFAKNANRGIKKSKVKKYYNTCKKEIKHLARASKDELKALTRGTYGEEDTFWSDPGGYVYAKGMGHDGYYSGADGMMLDEWGNCINCGHHMQQQNQGNSASEVIAAIGMGLGAIAPSAFQFGAQVHGQNQWRMTERYRYDYLNQAQQYRYLSQQNLFDSINYAYDQCTSRFNTYMGHIEENNLPGMTADQFSQTTHCNGFPYQMFAGYNMGYNPYMLNAGQFGMTGMPGMAGNMPFMDPSMYANAGIFPPAYTDPYNMFGSMNGFNGVYNNHNIYNGGWNNGALQNGQNYLTDAYYQNAAILEAGGQAWGPSALNGQQGQGFAPGWNGMGGWGNGWGGNGMGWGNNWMNPWASTAFPGYTPQYPWGTWQ